MDKRPEQPKAVGRSLIQPRQTGIGSRVAGADGYKIVRRNIVGLVDGPGRIRRGNQPENLQGRRIDQIGWNQRFCGNGAFVDGS